MTIETTILLVAIVLMTPFWVPYVLAFATLLTGIVAVALLYTWTAILIALDAVVGWFKRK